MKTILFIQLICLTFVSSAQFSTDFYYYKNQQISLTPTTNSACVYTDISSLAEFEDSLTALGLSINFFGPDYVNTNENFAEVSGANLDLSILKSKSYIKTALPCYVDNNDDTLGIRRNIYLQLNGANSSQDLLNYAITNNLKLESYELAFPNWRMISIPDSLDISPIEVAREISLQPFCLSAEPDFVIKIVYGCSNDPFFPGQWNLNDTGQGGPGGYGINYCGAKAITQGNPDVLVGVFDMGIDKNHEDFNNLSPLSIDIGTSLTSPSQVYFDGLSNHGTPVAGIIGADADNNIGISGIAPDCPLVDMSNSLPNSLSISNANSYSNAFKWAADKGIQVINCSWGFTSSTPIPILEEGIKYALDFGRNGAGCAIVFLAGNSNGAIEYPGSSFDEIIVVGGVDQCGYRAQTTLMNNPSQCALNTVSCFGDELDVMAPAQLIPTTDYTGPQGIQDDHLDGEEDYIIPTFPPSLTTATGFNGTSSAAPHVTGVIALMLSVNPCLSLHQVDSIIAVTAHKSHQGVGFGFYEYTDTPNTSNNHAAYTGWHEEMGYGIIDAEACVLAAQALQIDCSSKCAIYDVWDEVIEIGQNQVTEIWNPSSLGQSEYRIRGTVVIPDGKTLVIENGLVVRFSDSDENTYYNEFGELLHHVESGIQIQPGGKLIIRNNAVLTSLCETEVWDGIEVFGNKNLAQNEQNQGVIEINTGGTIENARNAISVYGRDDEKEIILNSTGGIVRANNAIFRNNWRAIEFLSYHNTFINSNEVNNASRIVKTEFITNAELPDGRSPYAFITMYDVTGIEVAGNSFSNTYIGAGENQLGSGIISLDASFTVRSICDVIPPVGTPCPTANQNRNTFNRLYAGIVGKQGGSTGDINVNKADFTNCVYGVRAEGSYLNEITECNFQIRKGGASFPNNPSHFGIFASGSNGSLYEDNSFEHNGQVGAGTGRNLGVSTGLQYVTPTDVVKNEFTGLETGMQLWGDNTDPAIQLTQADCNNFNRTDNTTADIHHSSGELDAQGFCISTTINPESPASNQFFGGCDGSAFKWQLYSNPSTQGFQYNAYTINTGDFPYNACVSGNIDLKDCELLSNIPSSFDLNQACPNQAVLGPFMVKIDAWKQRYANSVDIITNLQQLYDGGNTANLINLISTQSNGQLKNTLLGASPFLSDEVLKAYVLSSPPHGHLKEVLIANSSLSNDILDLLETQNIPNGIINQIYAAQTGEPSDRDFLDAEINYTANRKLSNLNGLVRTYLDTNMLDSAVYYVENDNSLNASCLILALALKSDTSKVKQHIAIIQDEANHLSNMGRQVESDELNRFCNFYSFLMKIANRNGGYYSITDQEKQILQNFASTPSVVSSNARAILEFIYNDVPYIDAEPYLQLNSYQIEEEITPNGPLNSNGKLNAYPNPFSGQFFVEGELDGDLINAKLKIMDASGRLLYSQDISNSNFNLSIDMSSYDAGLYLIGVINNGEVVAVKRIIQK